MCTSGEKNLMDGILITNEVVEDIRNERRKNVSQLR